MNIEQIKQVLPHRDPFLFLDRVIEISSEEIIAEKTFPKDESFYKGHFPNNPIFPGVLIVEALAQASGILGFQTMNKTPEEGSIYVFAGIDKARFRSRVGPNDRVHLYSEIVSEKKGIWKFETKAEADNKIVCTATILCADRKA